MDSMATIPIDKVLDDFAHLALPDKEYTLDILNKQLTEEKRNSIANRAKEARQNYSTGKSKRGTATKLLKDLENA
jgi:hypothetical protein